MKSRMLIFVAVAGLAMVIGCSSSSKKTSEVTPAGSSASVTPLPPLPPPASVAINNVDPTPIPVTHAPTAPTDRHARAKATTDKVADSGTAKAATSSKLAKADGTRYVVKKGDTLSRIAKANYGDSKKAKQIALANKIADPNKIRAGQVLVLPAI